MSDKSKLRQFQMYPMQGGVLEATLFYDELTTEVIADGKHLDAGLLKLALKLINRRHAPNKNERLSPGEECGGQLIDESVHLGVGKLFAECLVVVLGDAIDGMNVDPFARLIA